MKLMPLAFVIGAAVGLSACQSLDHTQNAISTTKPQAPKQNITIFIPKP